MKLNKYFYLQEFVPQEVFELFGKKSLMFVDERCIKTALMLRKMYGEIHINDWLWGGDRSNSGFRHPYSKVGRLFSPHKSGKAIDPKFIEADVDYVKEDIRNDSMFFYKNMGISRIEEGVPHLHIDFFNNGCEDIKFFYP